MRHPQNDYVTVLALSVFAEVCEHEILAEHAWELAHDICEPYGLEPEDAIDNLSYLDRDGVDVEAIVGTSAD